MALPDSVLKRWQNKRRQAVLESIAKDPCALDVVVWAEMPLVPRMVDCLFEASIACDPPLRWALCGPEEQDLRRTLSRLHASVPGHCFIAKAPIGLNPHLIPIARDEQAVFAKLVSRTSVVFHASMNTLPEGIGEACAMHFADLVDVSGRVMTEPESQQLVADILSGTPRCRGDVVRLGTDMHASRTDFACASDAIAVIKALVSPGLHIDETGIFAGDAFASSDFPKTARARL